MVSKPMTVEEKKTYFHDLVVQILEKHEITTQLPDDMTLLEIATDIEDLAKSIWKP